MKVDVGWSVHLLLLAILLEVTALWVSTFRIVNAIDRAADRCACSEEDR